MASANHDPLYIGKMRSPVAAVTVANTGRDGSGTIVDVFVADAVNGSFVGSIRYAPKGAIATPPSDNVLRLFIYDGSAWSLLPGGEIEIASAPTPDAVTAGLSGTITLNMDLAPGMKIGAAIHTHAGAEDSYVLVGNGGDYSVS